ncbi:MAG: hypothetical protein ACYSQZ_05590 [Planctomycetota bacterium]|jgi:hypothetical protein
MTLLKEDGTVPIKTQKVSVNAWPVERLPEGIGLSVKDGWYFGIGFGLAIAIAVPLILGVSAFVIVLILSIFGGLGNLWL